MSKYPQSCYVTGVFQGVHPVQQMTDTFAKQLFAIETDAKYNPVIVFEATRSEASDGIAPLAKFRKGDLVKVSFNLRSNKTKEGRWITNVIAWDVRPFVPQSADDFAQPEPGPAMPAATETTTKQEPITQTPAFGDDLPF